MINNITLYRTFVAVAERGSVSAAARALYVSQPAISAELQTLETQLGAQLFFRTNRGVTLTENGRLLYDYVKAAFSFLESGEDKLREITGLRDGTLRVGASDMTLRFYLLDYLQKFRHLYPSVKLTVTNAPTPRTLSALRSGEIDFGVISGPADMAVKESDPLTLMEVRTVQDVFVCTEECPLARARGVTREALSAYPLIMLEGETSTGRYVQSYMGDDIQPAMTLATSDLILAFAERGLGVAAIVEDFAADAICAGRLHKIDLAEPISPRAFFLAYLRQPPLAAAARQIVSMIKNDSATAQPKP